ncbi:cytochrome P450 6B2-like, partial [Cotesia glomerata]|uniref:cytochrome P450 6B2-like n=1 Tax=Cotesia glomerata TaxID=32391 RepID=UPI001D016D04
MIAETISAILIIIVVIYYWSISTYGYWRERNVSGPDPLPLVGNFKDVLLGKKSFGRWLDNFYDQYPSEKFIGVFIRRQPLLIIKDLDILKDIFIRDFSKFPDRGLKTFEHAEPLSQHLVNLEHTKWRPLRHKLSPAFTSGKLKDMFYLLEECGDKFKVYVDKMMAEKHAEGVIEVRDLTARFTTDVIGTCAFGLQLNAMADEESEFRKMGKYVFHIDWKKLIRFRIREGAPWLYKLLAPIMHDSKVTKFFTSIMKETIAYRKANKIVKNDFIDLIMELQDNPEKVDIKLTDTLLTSQLFVFFLAGFETSSTTMSNALYELAQHHDYQDRLREEIKVAIEGNEGKLSYELVKNMKFMNMVFKGMFLLFA